MAGRNEILSFCGELLDIDRFDDHGPNGLQVPGGASVGLVASGVSANRELLERAVGAGAEMVVVHHGLFWESQPRALSPAMAARLRVLLDAEASLAAYHLPLDAHPEIGNNALLRDGLGLEPDPTPFGKHHGRAIGVIGRSQAELAIEELVARVAALLGREPLVFASGPPRIRKVGIVSGGAARSLTEAAALGLDAFLTGEPSEQAMADAGEAGIHFIAAGHHATERLGVRRLGELVAERFEVRHEFIDVPNPV